jgi:trigger factor
VAGTHEIQRMEDSTARLTIKLTRDELRSEYDARLKNLLKDVQLPGFRRGKVPASILEKKGGDSLKDDILNHIIGETINNIIKSEDFPEADLPLSQGDPQIEGDPKLDLENDLTFSLVYEVWPQPKIEKWSGFEVELRSAEVGNDDVKRELEKVRDRNAIVMERNDNESAKKNDVVTVDYCELDESGSPIEATKTEDYVWTLGTGQNIYKIDSEIIGMRKNETKDFDKKYPENFENKELAGTTKKLRVKVKTIKDKKLPALDDDLAQDVNEKFKTLDDLKKNIRASMETRLENEFKFQKEDLLFEKIIEANPFNLPESLVMSEITDNVRRLFGGGGAAGSDDVRRFIQSNAEFVGILRPQAVKKIKKSLILHEIAESENIEVTPEEYKKELDLYAEAIGVSSEDVEKAYKDRPQQNPINNIVKEKKAIALIESKNKIKQGKKAKYLDIIPENA